MLTIKTVSWKTNVFSCTSQHSNFAARLSWTRGSKSLMRNAGTVITAQWIRIIKDFRIYNVFTNSSCYLRTWLLNRFIVRDSWSCSIAHRSALVELSGLVTCGGDGLDKVAKQLVLGRSALDLHFQSGVVSKWPSRGSMSEEGWDMEKGEGQMTERRRQAHWRHPWAMHVCNTHKNVRSVRAMYVHQKNVRAAGECMQTLRRTHSSSNVGANPSGTTPTTKKMKTRRCIAVFERIPSDFLQVLLISLTKTWSTSLLSINRQMYEGVLLGFPRHALFLTIDVWRSHSRPGCQGPQWKYAGYLSTT